MGNVKAVQLLCVVAVLSAPPCWCLGQGLPEDQMYQKLLQRLNPAQMAAGKTPDTAGITQLPQASAPPEPGSDVLEAPATKRDNKPPPAAGSSSQAQVPRTPPQPPSATGAQQQARPGLGPAGSSKEPSGGTKPDTGMAGLAFPAAGSLSEPPPPITALPGGGVITGGSGGGSSSSSNGAVSKKAAVTAGSEGDSWPAAIRQLGNPSCVWLADEQACMPSQDNWLIPAGMPSSPYRRANLLAIARQRHCERYTKEGACWADQDNRCHWYTSGKTGRSDCRSADLLEVYFYSSTGFAGTIYDIPQAMTCPGSKAFEFFRCFAHPAAPDSCSKLGDCFPVRAASGPEQAQAGTPRSICLPSFFAGMTGKELDDFLAQLWAVDTRAYGHCAGTCWIKQAQICRQIKAATRKECEATPFCSFDRSKSRCLKRALEFESEFDYKVKRLYGLCLDIDNKEDCKVAELTKPKPTVDWKSYKDQAEPAKCNLS